MTLSFPEFAPKFREVFQCQELWLETNGYGFRRWPEACLHFDRIQVSHYGPHVFAKSPSNDEDIAFIREFLREHGREHILVVGEVRHYPRKDQGEGNTCSRAWGGTVAYWDKLLYGCCTAQGMAGAVGIPLTRHWRTEIMEPDLPCRHCVFSRE